MSDLLICNLKGIAVVMIVVIVLLTMEIKDYHGPYLVSVLIFCSNEPFSHEHHYLVLKRK